MIQVIERHYDSTDSAWGHIGHKTWRRIPLHARLRIDEMRKRRQSFRVEIERPSVAVVKELS